MIFPPPLQKGDSIAIISPSGKVDAEYIKKTGTILEQWGFRVIFGRSAGAEYARFAGTDQERFNDLQWALDHEDVRAILCSRGGYGAIRLMDKLSFKKFAKKPKWLIGYSDITVLHAAVLKEETASIHAPMCKHLATAANDDISCISLKNILSGKDISYTTGAHPLNKKGKTGGILRGGNLTMLHSLRGTPYDFIPDDTLLFIEDIGEKPYQVERMIYNLKLGGVLEKLSGLIIGQFTEYEEDLSIGKTLYEAISDLVSGYDYPVCFNFPVGHTEKNYPIIQGSTGCMEVKDDHVFLTFRAI